ncbi:beta-ketoacyl-ACP synthase III [Kineosporia succinea]|uniref:Beta-ketoacyl-[acyl-carrier-protein] synthase III n=1 Tax=Kineosporia succinea TaxID=84632 RepID=A0ABT9P644_9ACTN|nr:beta-ketoacyl-ACP synthase III [Kineosporia succinea]MDP9828143.1 3-oxoacyl-[acyl-carrier-protein] synthase-3 [Kineosporia succinea]
MSQIGSRRGAEYARILSTGAYRPERIVTNDEICEVLDSSDQWIRERTGIVTRRFAAPGETVADMGAHAGTQAIERAGLTPSDIDAVIMATSTHMVSMPSAAALAAAIMGCGRATSFDLTTACAGFTHGVSVANDMVRGGSARHVLVIGSDRMTDVVDPADRGSAMIFGDGAGAVVIGPSDVPGIGPTVWGSDADQSAALVQTRSWTEYRDEDDAAWPVLSMMGPKIFRWAVWEMAPVARRALEAAEVDVADLAAFVPHQANIRIIDQMAKQLKVPDHVVVARDVVDSGNTTAGSIPLALDRLITEGQVTSGGLALLIGFGAGLSYSAQVVELP